MANIAKKDIPNFIRKCYQQWRLATVDIRKDINDRMGMYVGGRKQWRDAEVTKREAAGRPCISINKMKPAVDQVEGDVRQNPPGPKVLPVGNGADGDTADIHAGLIREIEHRSNAQVAYITAARNMAITGYGVIELETEYVGERTFDQQCTIGPAVDPAMWFFDPNARLPARQDANWGGKIRLYSKEQMEVEFGKNIEVLKDRAFQSSIGWVQNYMGLDGNLAQINEWTGNGKGPYFVAEFYLREYDEVTLREYTDGVNRYDDETVPRGVREHPQGQVRKVQRPKITKYVADAFEVHSETEWLGTVIPGIPVLGQEVYIDGKLYRLSLISEAMDSQRALNYVATTATELAGLMPKAPWVGYKGQFEDPRWESANSEVWAYLEIKPTFGVAPSGESTLLPPPQRNNWEAPIQWLLALGAYFSDAIKAVTSIYDASLGQQKSDQSGLAITQLRSESNTGVFFVADNLHHAIQELYEQIIIINCQILSESRVVTIVRPDSQHELATINTEFPQGVDPATGKAGKAKWLAQGRYAVAVTVGPNYETIKQQTSEILTEFLKIDPQIMQVPGVAAMALRSISQGDPEIEGIADLLEPTGEQNPAQSAQQLAQAKQTIQQLNLLVQALQQKLAAQLPKIEADKWKAALDNVTKIRVAEISASMDADRQKADLDASHLESVLGMAHDTAMQASDQEHQQSIAQQQAATQSAQSAQDAGQQSVLAQQAQAGEGDE